MPRATASAGTRLCRGLTKEKVPGLGVCMCQCPSPTPPAPGHGAVAPFYTTHMRQFYCAGATPQPLFSHRASQRKEGTCLDPEQQPALSF